MAKYYIKISILLILFFLLGFLARFHYLFDLLSHFRLYFLLGFVILFFVSIYFKNKLLILIHAIFIIGILFSLRQFYIPIKETNHTQTLKIISLNILSQNSEYEKVRKFIKKENPEIITIQEMSPKWEQELNQLKIEYPYFLIESRNDNFGIAIYSKYPLEDAEILHLNKENIPYPFGTVKINDQSISILGIHTMPPIGSEYFELRNRQLKSVNEFIKQQEGELILLGDLNCTSFSSNLNILLEGTRLRDSRLGKGIQGSWSARMKLFYLTLDHAFVTDKIQVLDRRIGEDLGSDHYPVILNVGW